MKCARVFVWVGAGALLVSSLHGAERRSALGPSVLKLPVLEKRVERGILRPVPIELELPIELPARRVLVHYKIHGSKDWVTLELTRQGVRHRGAIPCLEVSTITGDILYYVRVHDASGAVIAYSGSRHQPYRVTILHDSVRGAAADEGRCPDPSDCPPGLPGCPSERLERVPCRSDDDCEGGASCGWEGFCELDERSYNWLTLELEGGVGVVPTTGACSIASQENEGVYCRRQRDGATYVGSPVYTNEPLALGTVPLRAVLGFERVVAENSTLGVRVGYAFLGQGPTAPAGTEFVPYSAELRAAHVFGDRPFTRAGLRPYAFVSGGYAMYDIAVSVRVREDVRLPPYQGGNDLEQTLDVWKRAGDAFVGVGSGLVVAPSPAFGFSAEARAATVFPFGALVVTGSIGARKGF